MENFRNISILNGVIPTFLFLINFFVHGKIGSGYMAMDAWCIWGACNCSVRPHAIFARVSTLALHEGK